MNLHKMRDLEAEYGLTATGLGAVAPLAWLWEIPFVFRRHRRRLQETSRRARKS